MSKAITPKELLEKARHAVEFGDFELSDYGAAMWELRLDNWSFRRIAHWLNKQGIECTHSQVHYSMKKSLGDHEQDVAQELDTDMYLEEKAAHENPEIMPQDL